MTISVAQFRADFPEFVSTELYPTPAVQFWLNFAYAMLNSSKFGNQIDIAAELFTAHFITLEAKSMLASKGGGIPGQDAGGPISSKSVSSVSVSYDTGAGTEPNAGHWNLTNYGTRFIWMVNMFGAGPVQLGIGYAPTSSLAWPGPDTTPSPSGFG